jgi:photosystem II stability/assembly factor-like uncharacterized protein
MTRTAGGNATALLVAMTLAGSVMASCEPGVSAPTVLPSPTVAPAQLTGPVNLVAIHMISATTGWAEGFEPFTTAYPAVTRLILRTTDGGQNWRNVTPQGLSPQVQGVAPTEYLDQNKAWVMGLATPGQIRVMRTIDGGTSWKETILRDSSVQYQLSNTGSAQLRFVDADHGWLFVSYGHDGDEAGALYKTVNGGAHWAVASKTDPGKGDGNAVPWRGFKTGFTFVDQKNGWLTVGYYPKPLLYVTRDAGTSWSASPYPDVAGMDMGGHAVSRPRFFSPTSGEFEVLAGQSVVYTTTNGGATWLPSVSPGCCDFYFLDANTGWALSWVNYTDSRTLFQTSDGGQHWRVLHRHLDAQTEDEVSQHFITNLSAPDFVSSKIGFVLRWSGQPSLASATATPGPSPSQSLLTTTDGGSTWTELRFAVS